MRRIGGAALALLGVIAAASLFARDRPARRATREPADRGVEPRPAPPSPARAREVEPAPQPHLVRVFDAETAEPVAGATVMFRADEGVDEVFGTTGGSGACAFDAALRGEIGARKDGYVPVWTRARGRVATLHITRGAPVAARVVLLDGAPVAGAHARVIDVESNDVLCSVLTGDDGRFRATGAVSGRPVRFEASHEGFATAARVEPRPPRDEIVLVLGGGAVIAGQVARDGVPVAADVTVRLRGGGDEVARARAGEDGAFRIEGLSAPAAYEVEALDEDLARGVAEDVEFHSAHESAWRVVELEPRTTLTVHVEWPEGTVPGYPSFGLRRDGASLGFRSWGFFDPPEGGSWELLVLETGWPVIRMPVELKEGARNEVTVRMDRSSTDLLRGVVLDEAGEPLELIDVFFGGARTSTGRGGVFLFRELPEAVDTLSVKDRRGVYAPWSRAGVASRVVDPIEIRLRVQTRLVGHAEGAVRDRLLIHFRRPCDPLFGGGDEVGTRRVLLAPDGSFSVPWPAGDRAGRLWLDPVVGVPLPLELPAISAGEARDLGTLRFLPGRPVEGAVLSAAGDPIPGARLALEIDVLFRDLVAYTDRDGRFSLARLPDAPAGLAVTADGFAPLRRKLDRARDLQGADLRLSRTDSE